MFIYSICTQYLVGAPFALITASIRRGTEVISLWHCWGGMEAQVALTVAFRPSALLGLVSLIFLLIILHRFSMGFRSGEFAGQSSTVTPWSLNQLLVPLAVWAGAKSCWKIYIYIYIYAFSRRFYPKRLTVHSEYTCFISMCVPWESNPQPFALLTQCSTTEPQEHVKMKSASP